MKRFLALLLLVTVQVLAVGPKIPYVLVFTPSPSEGVTGYWLYWSLGWTTNWTDACRYPISTNSWQTGTDLRLLGLPRGDYTLMMTATNMYNAESDPSVSYHWHFDKPVKPSDIAVW